jgi:hypothetical protein
MPARTCVNLSMGRKKLPKFCFALLGEEIVINLKSGRDLNEFGPETLIHLICWIPIRIRNTVPDPDVKISL